MVVTPRSDGSLKRLVEFVVDAFLVLGMYMGAFGVRYGFSPRMENLEAFFWLMPLIGSIVVVVFFFGRLSVRDLSGHLELAYRLMVALIVVGMLTAAAAFFDRRFAFPRSIFVLGFVFQFFMIYALKSYGMKRFWSRQKSRRAMFIGPFDQAVRTIQRLSAGPYLAYDVQVVAETATSRLLEQLSDFEAVFLGAGLDAIDKSRIMAFCLDKGISVLLLPDLFELMINNAPVRFFRDMTTVEICDLSLSLEQTALKRAMDLVLGLCLLILFLLPMGIIGLFILLQDGGPVIYRQERLTVGNRRFTMLKFRTMIPEAEKESGPVLAVLRDQRVSRFGRTLRRTRLDELPQLLNVIRGDMSLVGPRPERPAFVERYQKDVAGFGYRLAVKAGMTGLAQIRGAYAMTPEDKLRLDLMYIRGYSFLLDMAILGQTISTLFHPQLADGIVDDTMSARTELARRGCRILEER